MLLALFMPLLALLAVAAAIDLRSRRIPNWLTALIAVGGLAASVAWTHPPATPLQAVLGMLVGLLINLPLFALGLRGGGDVKLFSAVGAWLGPIYVVAVFVAASLVAFAAAVVQAIAEGRLRAVSANAAALAVGMAHGTAGGMASLTDEDGRVRTAGRKHLPYAVPVLIAVVALLALLSR